MRIDRESFIRFAVAVALACYDLPADRAMTSEEAAQLVKWVIDMALGPDASNVQVEPMENYPASSKMPLMVFRKSVGTCFRCGDPLFLSDIPEYTCQCFRCDEDFYSIEQDVDL